MPAAPPRSVSKDSPQPTPKTLAQAVEHAEAQGRALAASARELAAARAILAQLEAKHLEQRALTIGAVDNARRLLEALKAASAQGE